jgi:hypothetical protein
MAKAKLLGSDHAEDIRCPRCNEVYEEYYQCVSYWGDRGPLGADCDGCGKPFFVEEHVLRSWSTFVKR